jgi:hypothetical protein
MSANVNPPNCDEQVFPHTRRNLVYFNHPLQLLAKKTNCINLSIVFCQPQVYVSGCNFGAVASQIDALYNVSRRESQWDS